MAEVVFPESNEVIDNSPTPTSAAPRSHPNPQNPPDSNDALPTVLRDTIYKSPQSSQVSLEKQSPDTPTYTPTDTIPSILISSTSAQSIPAARSRTMPPPTIQFAPLPELEPRKRNPSLQLGVAARSRLLRNRRMMMAEGSYVDENGEVVGATQYVIRGHQMSVWEERDPGLGDDAVEEAFIALGRLVKDASKTLWKKMSNKEIRKKASRDGENGLRGESASAQEEKKGKKNKSRNHDSSPTSAATSTSAEETKPSPPLPVGILKRERTSDEDENLTVRLAVNEGRHCFEDDHEKVTEMGVVDGHLPAENRLGEKEEEKGGVWEEEVGENFRRRLSGVPTRDEISYQPPELPKTDVVQTTTVISVCTSTVEALGNGSRRGKTKAARSTPAGSS